MEICRYVCLHFAMLHSMFILLRCFRLPLCFLAHMKRGPGVEINMRNNESEKSLLIENNLKLFFSTSQRSSALFAFMMKQTYNTTEKTISPRGGKEQNVSSNNQSQFSQNRLRAKSPEPTFDTERAEQDRQQQQQSRKRFAYWVKARQKPAISESIDRIGAAFVFLVL